MFITFHSVRFHAIEGRSLFFAVSSDCRWPIFRVHAATDAATQQIAVPCCCRDGARRLRADAAPTLRDADARGG